MKPIVMNSGKRVKHENKVQLETARYLQLKYPDVIFTSESSGVKMTMGQAMNLKRLRCIGKLPDLFIDEPRGIYHGMRLELKEEKNSPFTKDGQLKKKWDKKQQLDINLEQANMLKRLRLKGYYAKFSIGMAMIVKDIDYYMSLPKNYDSSRFPDTGLTY